MTKILIITRRHLILAAALMIALTAAWLYFGSGEDSEADIPVLASAPDKIRDIHIVTGEFASTLDDGTKIEAYRWDPGTILVEKGETVNLIIRGVNGKSHPFIIEGTNIKGEVKKGEETVVRFTPKKEGVYRLICIAHPDASQNGPMIAYIHVD